MATKGQAAFLNFPRLGFKPFIYYQETARHAFPVWSWGKVLHSWDAQQPAIYHSKLPASPVPQTSMCQFAELLSGPHRDHMIRFSFGCSFDVSEIHQMILNLLLINTLLAVWEWEILIRNSFRKLRGLRDFSIKNRWSLAFEEILNCLWDVTQSRKPQIIEALCIFSIFPGGVDGVCFMKTHVPPLHVVHHREKWKNPVPWNSLKARDHLHHSIDHQNLSPGSRFMTPTNYTCVLIYSWSNSEPPLFLVTHAATSNDIYIRCYAATHFFEMQRR